VSASQDVGQISHLLRQSHDQRKKVITIDPAMYTVNSQSTGRQEALSGTNNTTSTFNDEKSRIHTRLEGIKKLLDEETKSDGEQ